MSSPRKITPHVAAQPLVCGEYSDQGSTYTNWRPRGSGDWLLIHTLVGAGHIVANGRTLQLDKGKAVLFSVGAAQDYATDPAIGHWSLQWAHFTAKPHWQTWLTWPEFEPGVGSVQLSAEAMRRLTGAMNRMLFSSRLGGSGAIDLAMNALEEALLWVHRDLAGDPWLLLDERIRKAIAHLSADPARPFSIAELARHCGLSSSRLSHLFKTEVNMTPRQFSEKLRMDLAKQLLTHTGLNVSEVAYRAGFTDALYFSRRFTHTFGRSPVASRAVRPQKK